MSSVENPFRVVVCDECVQRKRKNISGKELSVLARRHVVSAASQGCGEFVFAHAHIFL